MWLLVRNISVFTRSQFQSINTIKSKWKSALKYLAHPCAYSRKEKDIRGSGDIVQCILNSVLYRLNCRLYAPVALLTAKSPR
jgi:hypothetical protein